MHRYFIEVAYKGTRYSGFQVQQNANTVQAEVEKAFAILQRKPATLTGSSRTDAGVHALQNYFHFDFDETIHPHFVYKMNAILPQDIVIKSIRQMHPTAHCRFDALSRTYEYKIYQHKNPFLKGVAFYYPYTLNMEIMERAANLLLQHSNFSAFSKTNTQVKNFNCTIINSYWCKQEDSFIYYIEANRFLRGMVRLLTGTMLKIGREQLGIEDFQKLLKSNTEKCGHSIPPDGLFLKEVKYPDNYWL